MFILFICACTARILETQDTWTKLGGYGLGLNGQLRVDLEVLNGTLCSKEYPRALIILTPAQEELWGDFDSEIDLDRPAAFRYTFCSPGEKISYTLIARDKPEYYTVGIVNPTLPGVSFNSIFRDRDWWSWFTDDDSTDDTEVRQPQQLVAKFKVVAQQADGGFLELQMIPLPSVAAWLSVGCLCAVGLYEVALLSVWRSHVTQLHVLYVFVFLLLSLYLWIYSYSLESSGATGHFDGLMTRTLPEFLARMFDAGELAVYLMTALGWKTTRPRLTPLEIRFISILIGITVYIGIFEISCGPGDSCSGYRLTRLIASSIAYLAVIVAINFHVAHTQHQLAESNVNGQLVGRLYQKQVAFSSYRNLFLVFLLQPTLVLYYRASMLSWREDWAFIAVYWATRGVLLAWLAILFRPRPKSLRILDLQ